MPDKQIAIQRAWQERAWQARDFDTASGLWDQTVRDLHRAAVARLHLARSMELSDQAANAQLVLKNLHQDLANLEKNDEVKKILADCLTQARGLFPSHPPIVSRLEALSRDLGAEGGFFWLRQTALARLQQLAPK